MANIDPNVVADFGQEWSRFDQSGVNRDELKAIFDSYFKVFPWESLPVDAVGADIGCGSGRWARFVVPRVGHLHCIEPSSAIKVAEANLADFENVSFYQTDVDAMPLEDESLDFLYSLGVLHHIPDTALAMKECVKKLKPGGLALFYLYYRFDNRPAWYGNLWQISEKGRSIVSKLPPLPKHLVSDVIAASIYWPLARLSKRCEEMGVDVKHMPLSAYRDKSFYTMRTDSLDRFGTRLEQRFSRSDITKMMLESGLQGVRFSEDVPFWCAVGTKG